MNTRTLQVAPWIVVVVATACSGPKVSIVPGLKQATYRIAILTFASSGFLSSQKPGKFAADEFAKFLALQQRAVIIDRSLVNSAAVSAGITSSNFLPHAQLKTLARELNAQLVILGQAVNLSPPNMAPPGKADRLLLNCRILEPDSGALVGLLSHEGKTSGSIRALVSDMTEQMVNDLHGLRISIRIGDNASSLTSESGLEGGTVIAKPVKQIKP